MQVFDFDNTLYHGESSYDFAKYIISKHKNLLFLFPNIFQILFLYKICKIDINGFTSKVEKIVKKSLPYKNEVISLIKDFWLKNAYKLDFDMIAKIHKEDVILTACPDFLIEGMEEALHTNHILCTVTDLDAGRILYLNFKENKVNSFFQKYPHAKITNFYTDSYNDQPFMDVAKHVYLVKNGKCMQIK